MRKKRKKDPKFLLSVPILSNKYSTIQPSMNRKMGEIKPKKESDPCPNCGCISSENSLFCDNCGAEL